MNPNEFLLHLHGVFNIPPMNIPNPLNYVPMTFLGWAGNNEHLSFKFKGGGQKPMYIKEDFLLAVKEAYNNGLTIAQIRGWWEENGYSPNCAVSVVRNLLTEFP